MANRLKKGDITLRELVTLSENIYLKKEFDDKARRAKLDITGASLTLRTNLKFNKETNNWEQAGREVKLQFIVESRPISYKRPAWDNFPHKYPVIFLFKDWEKNFDSPIKIRVGSLKKPKIINYRVSDQPTKQLKERLSKLKQRAAEYNIKAGIQQQFFFEMMRVYRLYGILFGIDTTNGNPKITNPTLTPYLSKHEYYLVINVLPQVFNSPKIKKHFKKDESNEIKKIQKEINKKEKELNLKQKEIEEKQDQLEIKDTISDTAESEVELDTSIVDDIF